MKKHQAQLLLTVYNIQKNHNNCIIPFSVTNKIISNEKNVIANQFWGN